MDLLFSEKVFHSYYLRLDQIYWLKFVMTKLKCYVTHSTSISQACSLLFKKRKQRCVESNDVSSEKLVVVFSQAIPLSVKSKKLLRVFIRIRRHKIITFQDVVIRIFSTIIPHYNKNRARAFTRKHREGEKQIDTQKKSYLMRVWTRVF